MNLSINSEKYKRGLEYEVLSECINIEIAERNALRYEAGKDTELGQIHFEAMIALRKLHDSVRVRDENTIKKAWVVLDAMEAERKRFNQLEPAPLAQYGQNSVSRAGSTSKPVAATC